ncbi:nucleolar complex protein 4 homolog B isoform X2 [Drosophila novamexicana]|uniref:nucleolar complex protein 4 homolog B isoform X2 n=1 Tax=Drosophila novamexicana TaxID=47314 RepID=UPI0011E5C33B|nr:nucleolar complex protein 4 homolog B isoform X2 [Drosophila novamexicana]
MKQPLAKKSAHKADVEVSAKRVNVPAELQQKANAFLNSSNVDTKVLREIVYLLEEPECNAIGVMHVLEVIFKNLLKRKCILSAEKQQDKTKSKGKANQPNAKCQTLYNKAWSFMLVRLGSASKEESGVALKVCMQLISSESKYIYSNAWPSDRLRSVLETLVNSETTPPTAVAAFQKYARCLDVLQMTYQLLPELAPNSFADSPNIALNYLAIINLLDLGKTVLNAKEYHIGPGTDKHPNFEYNQTRKHLNAVWKGIIASCSGVDEKVHRQVLVVLLERILPHLQDPILLTDFLMDSLHQFDGPIALLALQGIFTLMQQQNITYPDVYQKLYNMFYPRMFYNKYKARLFYLADIFLTSTHLPENLVAAFVKRLARLALKSPTEDAIIMIRFICNLLLRHTGLQRLICATGAESAVEISDPYDETELDPVKAGALKSSLWEMSLLQKHAVPEVANAARFVSKSLPVVEFDLSSLLEMKECDIFDDGVKKEVNHFTLGYERPSNFALPQNDIVTKYWDII